MTDETRTLIRYRLERAEEALHEAVLLLDNGHANTCVNRLYYQQEVEGLNPPED